MAYREGESLRPLSVVIPVYGHGLHLRAVIDALERQSVPVEQIIVSHSGAGDLVALLRDKPHVTVLHSDERLFAGAARNRGIELVTTDWVAFIDEDVLVGEDWHATLLKVICDTGADCILGPLGDGGGGGYWGTCTWLTEFSGIHPHIPSRAVRAGASANMAVDRVKFKSIGAFPEEWRISHDTVSQLHLRAAGQRIWYDNKLLAWHINVPGLKYMLRHQFEAGRDCGLARRAYPELPGGLAAQFPPLSFGLWLVRLGYTIRRVAGGPGRFRAFLHAPGAILGLLAWNAGFCVAVFRSKRNDVAEL
jgi:glycosyltransferase involved in cell wall biosynthesis